MALASPGVGKIGSDEDSSGEAEPNISLLSDGEAGSYGTPATPVRESYLFSKDYLEHPSIENLSPIPVCLKVLIPRYRLAFNVNPNRMMGLFGYQTNNG